MLITWLIQILWITSKELNPQPICPSSLEICSQHASPSHNLVSLYHKSFVIFSCFSFCLTRCVRKYFMHSWLLCFPISIHSPGLSFHLSNTLLISFEVLIYLPILCPPPYICSPTLHSWRAVAHASFLSVLLCHSPSFSVFLSPHYFSMFGHLAFTRRAPASIDD